MSYLEIMQALEQGQKVYWINSGRKINHNQALLKELYPK